MTLIFNSVLGAVKAHLHAKFHPAKCSVTAATEKKPKKNCHDAEKCEKNTVVDAAEDINQITM